MIEKKEAFFILESEFIEIEDFVEKAQTIMQDIEEDFFDRLNPKKEKDVFSILYDFDRETVRARIVMDMINSISGVLNTLNKEISEERNERIN